MSVAVHLGAILLLAVLIEGVVEYLGTRVPSTYKPYFAATLAVVICVAYGADLPAVFGLRSPLPYVGSVFTGLVVGRGSNYLNDLITRLNTIKIPAANVKEVQDQGTIPGPVTVRGLEDPYTYPNV